MPARSFRFLLKLKRTKNMNQHTSSSTDQHQRILLLLPWYLNQSLEHNERQQVENHLRSCILCRRELGVLRKLAAAVNQSSVLDVAAEASFAGVRAKLQTVEPVRQNPEPSSNQPALAWYRKHANDGQSFSGNAANRHSRLLCLSGGTVKRLAIAVSMLLAMIPLTMQYERSPVTPDYYTLSAVKPESPVGAKLHVVFSKSLPDAGIDSLLEKIHGQLVEGPNSVGAYTVRLDTGKDSSDLTAAIAFLRNQQYVLLAEPVIDP
jgi:hypothetical protein